jgi:ribose transport system substrate-binding protein
MAVKKSKKISILTIVALAVPLIAVSSYSMAATSYKGRPKTILMVQPMKDHPVHRLMQAGFLAECKRLGYTCKVVGNASASQWDDVGSLPLVDAELARKKYGGVAVYPVSPVLFKYAEKLAKKGYPIIGWHAIPKAGTTSYLASVAQLVPNAGKGPAEEICKIHKNQGTVAITEGSLNDEENTKAAAFKETLAKACPNMKTTEIGIEGFDPTKAVAIAVGMLSADKDIVAAYSTTGNGAQTWSQAASQSNRKITIIGMDYIRQNLDLIRDGKVYGVVAQPLYEETAMMVQLFDQAFKGQKVKYENILPSVIVTKANLDQYYKIVDAAGQ